MENKARKNILKIITCCVIAAMVLSFLYILLYNPPSMSVADRSADTGDIETIHFYHAQRQVAFVALYNIAVQSLFWGMAVCLVFVIINLFKKNWIVAGVVFLWMILYPLPSLAMLFADLNFEYEVSALSDKSDKGQYALISEIDYFPSPDSFYRLGKLMSEDDNGSVFQIISSVWNRDDCVLMIRPEDYDYEEDEYWKVVLPGNQDTVFVLGDNEAILAYSLSSQKAIEMDKVSPFSLLTTSSAMNTSDYDDLKGMLLGTLSEYKASDYRFVVHPTSELLRDEFENPNPEVRKAAVELIEIIDGETSATITNTLETE